MCIDHWHILFIRHQREIQKNSISARPPLGQQAVKLILQVLGIGDQTVVNRVF